MEIAATIAPHNFQLTIDGLDDVGGGKRFPHVLGIFQERHIVFPFLTEFSNPSRIGLGEAIAQLFKLNIGEFQIPTSFDGAPALLKLKRVGLGQMRFGVALHVNDAKLGIGIGEQTRSNRQQATKVIVNDNHDAA